MINLDLTPRSKSPISLTMTRQNYCRNMTEVELDALLMYVRTLPPLEWSGSQDFP